VADDALMILHDHYKDTFGLIREREKQRDRSFLALIGLFAVLFLEVQYPSSFRGSANSIAILGAKVDVSSLPLAALLDASWVLTLTTVLSYCRAAVNIERQYSYLHKLEQWISRTLAVEPLYQREGLAYLQGYPVVLDWAWICYVFVFPALALIATLTLLAIEWKGLSYSPIHKFVDTGLGLSIVVSLTLYRVVPNLMHGHAQEIPAVNTAESSSVE